MTIKQFIEKAIEGGWEYRGLKKENGARFESGSLDNDFILANGSIVYLIPTERILLDLASWRAVGKALKKGYVCSGCGRDYVSDSSSGKEIWDSIHCKDCDGFCEWWYFAFTKMSVHLADGKTIEEYLETL